MQSAIDEVRSAADDVTSKVEAVCDALFPTTRAGRGQTWRYVLSGENRSAGSVMRRQLAPYCNEQRFIFERWRNR